MGSTEPIEPILVEPLNRKGFLYAEAQQELLSQQVLTIIQCYNNVNHTLVIRNGDVNRAITNSYKKLQKGANRKFFAGL